MYRFALALAVAALLPLDSAFAGSLTVRNCYSHSSIDVHSFNSDDGLRVIARELASEIAFKDERTLGCDTDECLAKVYFDKPPLVSGGMSALAGGLRSSVSFVYGMSGGPLCFRHVEGEVYSLSPNSCSC